MAFNNACFHSFLNSRGKTSDGERCREADGVMAAATAAHEIRSGATEIESHSPGSPRGFPQRQEVAALEADDFLWDGFALGLC